MTQGQKNIRLLQDVSHVYHGLWRHVSV